MKPMLAEDAVESKIKFPCILQPKIDGVRGMHLDNGLTGRSLKRHANVYTTDYFSADMYKGIDGELAAGLETSGDLCRVTTSAVSRIAGEPFVLWHCFDLVTPITIGLPYKERLVALVNYVSDLHSRGLGERLRLMPSFICYNFEQLLELDAMWLDMGYEGSIVRDPDGKYKQGRSTVNEGGLLRIKRFVEEEAEVLEIIEGETNTNEAQTNELGQQFRSSHQDNMVPNGMVGAIICRSLKTNEIIKVGAGKLSHDERFRYFQNQDLLLHKIIKYQHFPKGVKDKPRFPTFQSFRAASDIGE